MGYAEKERDAALAAADDQGIKAADATIRNLNRQWDTNQRQQATAIKKRDAALKADKGLTALQDAQAAALDAWNVAMKDKPLGYRVGPVAPAGFTFDLPTVLAGQHDPSRIASWIDRKSVV